MTAGIPGGYGVSCSAQIRPAAASSATDLAGAKNASRGRQSDSTAGRRALADRLAAGAPSCTRSPPRLQSFDKTSAGAHIVGERQRRQYAPVIAHANIEFGNAGEASRLPGSRPSGSRDVDQHLKAVQVVDACAPSNSSSRTFRSGMRSIWVRTVLATIQRSSE